MVDVNNRGALRCLHDRHCSLKLDCFDFLLALEHFAIYLSASATCKCVLKCVWLVWWWWFTTWEKNAMFVGRTKDEETAHWHWHAIESLLATVIRVVLFSSITSLMPRDANRWVKNWKKKSETNVNMQKECSTIDLSFYDNSEKLSDFN